MIFKEETIDSKLVYDGKVIKVCEEQVRIETGRTATREIVVHRGAVALIALTDDDKIVLVKQYRKAIDDVVFEIPAGKIEDDDNDIAYHRSDRRMKNKSLYKTPALQNPTRTASCC